MGSIMKNVYFLMGVMGLFMVSCTDNSILTVKSPDSHIVFKLLRTSDERITYAVSRNGSEIVTCGTLGIRIDDIIYGRNGTVSVDSDDTVINETYDWRGVHSVAHNHYRRTRFTISAGEKELHVELRVYDDGVAWRYTIPLEGTHQINEDLTSWQLPSQTAVWYHSQTLNFEGTYSKENIKDIPDATLIALPFIGKMSGNDGYIVVAEGGLFDFSGMELIKKEGNRLIAVFDDDPKGFSFEGTVVTPWRLIILADDLDRLVNSDLIHNVCPAPDERLKNADWIRPGRAVWNWWALRTSGSPADQRRFVDAGAKLGFEYNLVDEGWENWKEDRKSKWDIIKELVDYSRNKGIDTWIWRHWDMRDGYDGSFRDPEYRRSFFKKAKSIGVVGLKIDFMDSESLERVRYYTAVLEDAAEVGLMINFHGANKPTGESRTYPHEMTREGIYGLEQNFNGIPVNHYATLPFTRLVAGHGDFTVITFQKDYLGGTTFALQLASAVAFTSPVQHFADFPELYLESRAADVIKALPATWDETVILPGSEIGELAAMARRKGDQWFVALLNGETARHYNLSLPFLGEGIYDAQIFADRFTEPAAFDMTEGVYSGKNSMQVHMVPGGGWVGHFKPVNEPEAWLMAEAGERYLNKRVNVTFRTNIQNGTIYYTRDGTVPGLNSKIYTDPVEIKEPGILRAVLVDDAATQKASTEISFEGVDAPRIEPAGYISAEEPVEVNILEAPLTDGTLYYTTDGSEPTPASIKYEGPFVLEKSTLVRSSLIPEEMARSNVTSALFAFENDPRPGLRGTVAGIPLEMHKAWNKPVKLLVPATNNYGSAGDVILTNGFRGSNVFSDGQWLGFEADHFRCIIDLENLTDINTIVLGFFRDMGSWIFFPKEIRISFSNDGKVYSIIDKTRFPDPAQMEPRKIIDYKTDCSEKARYIKIEADNIITCPDWHPGAGGKAWLFVDEVMIK